ncbi:hypothetical protein UO65_2197 [Actinokineospora spheciospongiae]|uniref:Uncharacterized protein n=1 Tax=Actinokineospora spheciospongiae TaxID=909613 RepID=W7INP1_9PSEU|nr:MULTISPECIES: hypothetical protein [Actinokineospora]EWC62510.1 hypothetical protein UO65_2197 [Actinokineospora spheciospongiae]MCG8919060.1 hypothetical protein [Actinokineospora sp. PR83]PWW63018.1 hypothetical protein DFQ13_1048 [Actinokineospora spheciospongiae]
MAGLLNRIKAFLSGPKGRAMMDKARQAAQDPRNQQRAKAAVAKLRNGRRR